MKFFVNINYYDRIEAKQYGFLWDSVEKKWFLNLNSIEEYKTKFDIIKRFDNDFIIAKELYLFKILKKCNHCKQYYNSYFFAVKNYCDFYYDFIERKHNNYNYNDYKFFGEDYLLGNNKFLAFVEIDDYHLLNEIDGDLKRNYNIYSEKLSDGRIKLFNHCMHCNHRKNSLGQLYNFDVNKIELVKKYNCDALISFNGVCKKIYDF